MQPSCLKPPAWQPAVAQHRQPGRVLVCGWFSFERGGNTAGDSLVLEVLCGWLKKHGLPFDVARESACRGDGVDWTKVDASAYRHLIFVCGPVMKDWPDQARLFDRFRGKAQLVGVNVSLITQRPGLEWNPFDVVLCRDGMQETSPDMAFASEVKRVPVVGLLLRGHQGEYGESNCLHETAEQRFAELLAARPGAVVPIDTVVPGNQHGLRSPEEVVSVIGKCDVVLTTRLHGGVLALKNGVPAIAIDQVRGGAKVVAGLSRVGWPAVFMAEELTAHDRRLTEAFDWSLTEQARHAAEACARRGKSGLAKLETALMGALLEG